MSEEKKGTFLEADAFSLNWNPRDGFTFAMPSPENEEEDVPVEGLFLMAAFHKVNTDPVWASNLVDEIIQKVDEIEARNAGVPTEFSEK